jgi:hypothetical protein
MSRENMSNECPSCNHIGYGRENISLGERVRKRLATAFVADQQDERRAWRFRIGILGVKEALVLINPIGEGVNSRSSSEIL